MTRPSRRVRRRQSQRLALARAKVFDANAARKERIALQKAKSLLPEPQYLYRGKKAGGSALSISLGKLTATSSILSKDNLLRGSHSNPGTRGGKTHVEQYVDGPTFDKPGRKGKLVLVEKSIRAQNSGSGDQKKAKLKAVALKRRSFVPSKELYNLGNLGEELTRIIELCNAIERGRNFAGNLKRDEKNAAKSAWIQEHYTEEKPHKFDPDIGPTERSMLKPPRYP